MNVEILDVDLLAFETGDAGAKRAVVDGVRRSLGNGFVYTAHDLSSDMLDEAYDMLATFFASAQEEKERYVVDGAHGQTGYTGLLVETAADAEHADWKEMLNWAAPLAPAHPLRTRYPASYPDPVLPEATVPGVTEALLTFHRQIAAIQKRFLRVIAAGIGCAESFFDEMVTDGPTLTRAIRYPPMNQAPGQEHVWAGAHDDINLITALPRATAKGLQVLVNGAWVDVAPPDGHMIINTGLMLERLTNGVIGAGTHRVIGDPQDFGERLSVVQFCHPTPSTVLSPVPTCVNEEHPLAYRSISANDALEKVLWDINLID